MRNFLWKGNTSQKNYGMISWSRACAPYEEGGVGARDIRAANNAFLYKLAWEIIIEKDKGHSFIFQRHTTAAKTEVKYFIASSIWHGLNRIRSAIREESRWLPGQCSSVKFWVDNWLGYSIADRVGVPLEARANMD